MKIDIFSYNIKGTTARLIILAVLSYLILILFGWSLSPFNDTIVGDTVVFKMMGEAWGKGYIPYRDFFDHKGPLHYLIQLIIFSISDGKVGLLILETLNAVAIFELLYRCGKDLGANIKLNLLSLFVSMNLFAVFIGQGDNVEEWSLPYQIFPLWLAIRYLKGTYFSITKLALITGLCFGATTLIRVNNNCVLCGIVIGLTIVFLLNKSYKELLTCVAYFIVGMVAIILPFVVYFYINDALSDMIYCNLTFNFHYKSNSQFSSNEIRPFMVLQLIQCLILPITSWVYDRQNYTRMFPMMTAMSVLSFYVFIFSAGFYHYFLMIIPIAALCVLTSASIYKQLYLPIVISLVIMFPIISMSTRRNAYRLAVGRIVECEKSKTGTYTDIIQQIPLKDRGSIYIYGWFDGFGNLLLNNSLPVGKYSFLQNMLCDIDSIINQDMRECFEASNPKWIISSIPSNQMKPLWNVSNHYELTYHDGEHYIYKRKYEKIDRVSQFDIPKTSSKSI